MPNCVPLGLAYLASVLRNAGHEVEVLDINAMRYTKEQAENKIKASQCDLIGTGGLITVAKYLKWLIETIKKHKPEIKVVVGGGVATSIPKLILENTLADIACIGEGEVTILEITKAIEKNSSLSDVAGIYYKDENSGQIIKTAPRQAIANLDSIPLPAYDLFPMDIYVNNPVGYINKNKWANGAAKDQSIPKSMNINVTRGCPYRCIYCYHDFVGAGYRHHSPEYVLNEMRFLNQHYGVTYFVWADDESMIKKRFIYQFCDLMKKEKPGFEFSISGRVNLVDRDILESLKEAGCNMVGYGIESGSQKMLDLMKKNATVEQSKNAIILTREVFGDISPTFVLGLPGETAETVQETIDFCKDVNLVPEAIFFATAYPGTELYDLALKKGLIKNEFEYICNLWEQGEQILVNFTEWSDKELFQIRENMIRGLKAWNTKRHAVTEKIA